MSTELNKTNALRVPLEMFNQGNMSAADEAIAPDYIEHAVLPPGLPVGTRAHASATSNTGASTSAERHARARNRFIEGPPHEATGLGQKARPTQSPRPTV